MRALTFLVALLIVSAGPALANETLANQSGCMECHHITSRADHKVVGPSFHEIAARYKGNARAQ